MKRKLVLITEIIAPYRIPVLRQLARAQDIDLHVIFLAENDPALRKWRVYRDELDFSYQVLPSHRHGVGRRNVLLNRGMTEALRIAQPDAVICGGYNYLAAWQASAWCRRHHVPFLLWIESTANDKRRKLPWVELLKSTFIKNCSAFVAAGVRSREYLLTFGVDENSVFTAPNAVDVKFFAEQASFVREDARQRRTAMGLPSRYILSVGRIIREKGVFDLLAAYSMMPAKMRNEIGLVFAGSGKADIALQERAKEISPGAIQFRGFCQREELPALYALADVFVLPTHSDPWGLVVNEAMSCSLPVLCTDVAGCVDDLVHDGRNGRVVPVGQPTQMASCLAELCKDQEALYAMGKKSLEIITGHSPRACAEGIAQAAHSTIQTVSL